MNSEDVLPEPQPDLEVRNNQPEQAGPEPVRSEPAETRFLKWILFGSHGVRVGWLVMLFLVLAFVSMAVVGAIGIVALHNVLHLNAGEFTPVASTFQESVQLLGLLAAGLVCALIERRSILDYNLRGERRLRHFSTGLVGGFLALSALVYALSLGGWLHFDGISLTGAAAVKFAVLWAIPFLLTGLSEEGMTRCYMLFTLARGLNYWWALGTVACLSLFSMLNTSGSGASGIYLIAALGVAPCLYLHLKQSPSAGFWEAAWLTSTFFGYIHTFNPGETWIGVFATAAVGFVFCVSVRLTGSAWWAIGFHAAWDWAQTYFYGTADSGLKPTGHFLATSPVGSAFWSGGSAGPEGSILILPALLLILLVMSVVYGRKLRAKSPFPGEPAQLS